MKEYTIYLPDGKVVVLMGKTYNDLLCEIDNFFDIFKDNVSYYLGCADESIIEEMRDQKINFKEI